VPLRFRYITCLASVALAFPAAAAALPSIAKNPANKLLSRGIDPMQYDRATHCNGGHVWAGTEAMVAWLEHNARGVNWGEYRCEKWGSHEASIHSDGRAIDWHPASKADAYELIRLLLAPDKAGNATALARRMGVQGLIFNCQAWWGSQDGELGRYSYCYGKRGKRKKNLDPTQAHMDHVHIELNRRGAAKKTTFWNRRIRYPVQTQQPERREPTLPQLDTDQQPQVPQADPQPQPAHEPVQDPGYGNGGGTYNDGQNWHDSGGQWGGGGYDDQYDDPYADDWP
jgi:hypothetical protein